MATSYEDAVAGMTRPQEEPVAPSGPVSYEDAVQQTESQPWYKSVLHGVVQSKHDLSTVAGVVYDYLRGPDWSPSAVRASLKDPNSEEAWAMQNPGYSAASANRAAENRSLERQGLYREPVNPDERAWSGAGRALAPSAGGAMAAGPIAGTAIMAGSVAGPFAGEYTQQALTPEGEQPGIGAVLGGTGAELLATLPFAMVGSPAAFSSLADNPSRVVQTIRRMRADRLAANAPPEAHELLLRLNQATKRLWGAMNRGARDVVGDAPQFDLPALFDISAYYKGRFPIDPDGNIDWATVSADLLERDLAAHPDIPNRPTQILERAGTSQDTMRRLEEGLVRLHPQGDEWSNVVAGQALNARMAMQRKFIDQLRGGGPSDYVAGAERTTRRVKQQATEAFRDLNFEAMPKMRLKYLEDGAREVVRGSQFQEDNVPKIVKRLGQGNSRMVHIDMEAVQNLRSKLVAIIRDGRDGGEAGLTAIKAREMLQHLDNTVEGMYTIGPDGRNAFGQFFSVNGAVEQQRLQRARRLWREYKEIEDPDKLSGGDFRRILESKNPDISVGRTAVSSAGDAELALRLAQDQHTRVSLERSVQQYIFGNPRSTIDPRSVSGFSKSPEQILDTINQNREGIEMILGRDYTNNLESLLEAWRGSKVGRVGTIAMETSTNTSGAASFDKLRKTATILRHAITDPTKAAQPLAQLIFDSMPSNADALLAMQTIQLDRRLMADVLRLPTEVDPPAYALAVERAIRMAQHQSRTPETLARTAEDLNIILNEKGRQSPWRKPK